MGLSGHHQCLVGRDHAHVDSGCQVGDQRGIDRILLFQQFDAKEGQLAADPASDDRRMLANAPGEDQRVQSSERGREGANPLSDLVAEDVDGQARTRDRTARAPTAPACRRCARRCPEGRTRASTDARPRPPRDAGAGQIGDDAGVEVSAAAAHDQASGRRQSHARVDAASTDDGCEAGAIPEMCKHHASVRRPSARDLFELTEQEGVGQAMKAVAAKARRLRAPAGCG